MQFTEAMSEFIRSLVRPTVTLYLTYIFGELVRAGVVSLEVFLPVFGSVVGFWFAGRGADKDKVADKLVKLKNAIKEIKQ